VYFPPAFAVRPVAEWCEVNRSVNDQAHSAPAGRLAAVARGAGEPG